MILVITRKFLVITRKYISHCHLKWALSAFVVYIVLFQDIFKSFEDIFKSFEDIFNSFEDSFRFIEYSSMLKAVSKDAI